MTDTINIPPYKQNEPGQSGSPMHPGMQFLMLIAVLIIALIIGTVLGLGIVLGLYGMKTMTAITTLNTAAPHFASALWVVQFAGTTLPILATSVFFAVIIVSERAEYLRTNFRFPPQLLLIVFAVMLFSFPVIELLSNINQKLPVPRFLQWMADNQKNEEKLMSTMLDMKSIWDVIYNVLFIGFLTAVVEEFLFRGCVQTILLRWTKNIHVAIWVTAILFSAFHMDYYGFLPRVLLGGLFGYFVAYSGSIWTSVWAHTVNNGTIVVVTYLYQTNQIKTSPDSTNVFNYSAYIISAVIILFLFWIYRRIALQQKPALH